MNITSEVLVNHFRCPEDYLRFETFADSSGAPGYFRFGSDVICYGRISTGFVSEDVRAELYDAISNVRIENCRCVMPFDPSAAVENLRRERYVDQRQPAQGGLPYSGFVRKTYYSLRPLLPVAVRKHLQRLHMRSWSKNPFPTWPVDRSVDRLLESLMMLSLQAQELDRIPFIWFWPDGKSSCAIMTHDVETNAGVDFCSTLMDLNDSFGIKSSFQIIPEGRYVTPTQLLNEIRYRKFEVNVHDWNHDGFLYSDPQVFLTRASKINRVAEEWGAEGFRSGVLYRNTDWYNAFTLSYDMSVPNVGHLDPQPGGCCTILPYFIGQVLEIPVTTTQDYPLFHILREFSIDLWKRQIDLILEGNGLASFIVHPDYIIGSRERSIYSELLGHLSQVSLDRKVWLALPREVNRWWRDRSNMRIVQKNGCLKIEGPGNERARIAFARSDGKRIIYSFD